MPGDGRCGLWDLQPLPGSVAWSRCVTCQLYLNERTQQAYEAATWTRVDWPHRELR